MRRNDKGFTLIEMLIVLLIISILILVTIPNVTKHFSTIDNKGCEAYLKMVQGQVEAYKIDHKRLPTLSELKTEGYLKDDEDTTCPNGDPIEIQSDGNVVAMKKSTSGNASGR
ncbi:competence type IV pilus major pilin ComGC [Ureibacillus sinduriensis]|uniref:ComG operon protein 3 n=1 Tax=Ureibacillus sinduriensis BLB-1 = JCM 15800 TaxID=1384057 RepID=A0A0A3HQC7_9BACL|nr:competence type IV pilus major pilin ComGC [Ureibacillus sinduriensis]KGR74609.1 competence protein ComG [Ureibacillus sinduriensis BLB-1 = JCM 15800]